MTREELEALAPIYALGALDGADLVEFERALATDTALRAVVDAHRETAASIGRSLPPVTPRAELKERVLAAVQGRTARPGAVRPGPGLGFWRLAAAAGLIGTAVLAWFLVEAGRNRQAQEDALAQLHRDKDAALEAVRRAESERTKAAEDGRRLRADVERLQRDAATTAKDIERLRKMDALIRDIAAQAIVLKGTDAAIPASGRIFWKDEQDVILIADLPPLPAGKIYELWAIVEGATGPLPAGVVDERGHKTAEYSKVPKGSKITGWAVSLEDKPVDTPTKVVLAPAQ